MNALNYNSETFKNTLSNLSAIKDEESIQKNEKKELNNVKNIKLSNIDFSYNENKTILQNISLDLKKGKMIGVVGKTGSGKTTLIDIISGLLEPSNGSLKVNERAIKDITIGAISYITQDTILMDDSILNNICFGLQKKNFDKKKFDAALAVSQLNEFIEQLPEKENTHVGDRGTRISGGQKQRIGIARAIYNDSEILIFDEATSALDYETEKKILNQISKLKENKIIIMITHRLNALKLCDELIVLERGKIKYFGKVDQLKNEIENFLEIKTD